MLEGEDVIPSSALSQDLLTLPDMDGWTPSSTIVGTLQVITSRTGGITDPPPAALKTRERYVKRFRILEKTELVTRSSDIDDKVGENLLHFLSRRGRRSSSRAVLYCRQYQLQRTKMMWHNKSTGS